MPDSMTLKIGGRAPEGTLKSLAFRQSVSGHTTARVTIEERSGRTPSIAAIGELLGKESCIRIEARTGSFELKGYVASVVATDAGLQLECSSLSTKADHSRRHGGFEGQGLVDILRTSLDACGIQLRTEGDVPNDRLEFVVQSDETTWEFVTRLAARHDLILLEDDQGVVVRRGKRDVASVDIAASNLIGSVVTTVRAVPTEVECVSRLVEPNRVVKARPKGAQCSSSSSLAGVAVSGSSRAFDAEATRRTLVVDPAATEEESIGEEARCRGRQAGMRLAHVEACTRQAGISVGGVVSFEDPPHAEGDWVVVEVDGEWRRGGDFTCRIVGVPEELFSSVPRASRARSQGVEEAIVTDDADPSELGRVKVQFHRDDASSGWIRVVSPAAGPGCGAAWVPRKGTRVVVGFLHGHADAPVVLGAVPHADAKPEFTTRNGTGEVRIAKTRNGSQVAIVEDSSGHETILLEQKNGNRLALEDAAQPLITLRTNGKFTIDALSFEVKAKDSIELSAARINVKGSAQATISAARIELNPPGGAA